VSRRVPIVDDHISVHVFECIVKLGHPGGFLFTSLS
jgi:hypothetical protein